MKLQPFTTKLPILSRLIPGPLVLGIALFQLAALPIAEAQSVKRISGKKEVASVNVTEPQAVVLAVSGQGESSEDGQAFSRLKTADRKDALARGESEDGSVKQLWGQALKAGTVVRTGKIGQTDIFFTRTGTTVRIQADSEVKIEKMERLVKRGEPVSQTVLNLTKGSVFVAVRAYEAGSTFEVKNTAGRAVIGGSGSKGRYIITADGAPVMEKDSDVPLKLITDNGTTVVAPTQKAFSNDARPLALEPSPAEKALIESDDFESFAELSDKQ